MLFRGMDRAALDVAYNNTAAVGVPKRDQYVSGWSARSDALRKTRDAKIDLRYGDGPRQRLDFFACGKAGAPTLAYIHGGYWQMNDKEPYAFFGEALLPAGFNLALVEYTLAPAARLDQIVAEVRAAVAWVIEHAAEHGGDARRDGEDACGAGRGGGAGHGKSVFGRQTSCIHFRTRLAGVVASFIRFWTAGQNCLEERVGAVGCQRASWGDHGAQKTRPPHGTLAQRADGRFHRNLAARRL